MGRFSKSTFLVLTMLMTVLLTVPAMAAENSDWQVKVDGKLLSFPEQEPVKSTANGVSGVTFLPLRTVSESMGAEVNWDQEERSVIVSLPNRSITLNLNSDQAVVNERLLIKSVNSRLINGHTMVPLRFFTQAWGLKLEWDKSGKVNIISGIGIEPKRIYKSSVPAQVAFSSNGSLYILNGIKAGAESVKIDTVGPAEIVGWSPTGKWLMYLETYVYEGYRSHSHIWVVSADGKNTYQIDTQPVMISPSWAPQADIVAYTTCSEGYDPHGNLKMASLKSGEPSITTLLPDNSLISNDIAWYPDGKSLIIGCTAKNKDKGLIKQVNLKGKCSTLLTVKQTDFPDTDDFFIPEAAKIKSSPDGHYLACYLESNCASLSADGAGIYLIDLEQTPVKVHNLGFGLHYKGWLAWSPDSTQLAYIEGSSREATINKQIHIFDVKNEAIISNCSIPGKVDTQPLWMADGSAVLFCRGTESAEWLGNAGKRLLVPEQHICCYKTDGKVESLTAGGENTADYAPNVSPDGSNLIFMHLEHNDRGSIYYKALNENKEMELINGISGDCGYYGNYYPDWISVYWEK